MLLLLSHSLQSCPTLCDPIDGSPPGSSLPGILQARTLEWVAISFSNSCMHGQSLQSCPTLCDLMSSSPPGSSVPGILQARTLEWVAISLHLENKFLIFNFLLNIQNKMVVYKFAFPDSNYMLLFSSFSEKKVSLGKTKFFTQMRK